MTSRYALALLGVVMLGVRVEAGTADSVRPNVVVLLSDDHRWDALGAAGNPSIITPVMDSMVRDGVYFRQATVSLLTGLPSFQHGVYSTKLLAPGTAESLCWRPTVSGLLREAGYRTVLVGKWHLPPPPWECGLDEVMTWLPEGGASYQDPDLVRGTSQQHGPVSGFTQEIFTDDALRFLRSKEAQAAPFLHPRQSRALS